MRRADRPDRVGTTSAASPSSRAAAQALYAIVYAGSRASRRTRDSFHSL
jgi:hypothetical protein